MRKWTFEIDKSYVAVRCFVDNELESTYFVDSETMPKPDAPHWVHKAVEMLDDRGEILRKWNNCPILREKAKLGLV